MSAVSMLDQQPLSAPSPATIISQKAGTQTDVETEGGPEGTLLISRIVYHVNESNICPQSGSYKEALLMGKGKGEGGWKDCRGQRDILINQMCKSHGTNRDSLIGNNYRGEEYKKTKKTACAGLTE